MPMDVFINFNENCREAVNFYAQVFGLEEPAIMTYGEAPPNSQMPVTEETKNLIMHASLTIFGTVVMFMDTTPDTQVNQGDNIVLTIRSKDLDEVQSLFNKMKNGGRVLMDLQETFYSKCYGMLIDKFGIPWQFIQDTD
ncbi:MAG TPA: VOC family protein [Atribacter sp.]|uniref:VOC family protein n=1 Tax=Atribacter sp. TaxID=2847780 RepID=UPI002BB87D4C|nr:VOC family protein [Atribacter sp.]HQK83823.1 VOC family protein [Atribacter sp.]